MKNLFRVMVKMQGSKRYQAVEETEDGIAIAPSNVIYHSFFTKENAEKLVQELADAGIDSKISK